MTAPWIGEMSAETRAGFLWLYNPKGDTPPIEAAILDAEARARAKALADAIKEAETIVAGFVRKSPRDTNPNYVNAEHGARLVLGCLRALAERQP